MKLETVDDLFGLAGHEIVSKRNLYDLIQFSKVEGSAYWSGQDSVISNTPQQGINWIGQHPLVRAVIIKTRPGSYKTDGWIDEAKTTFQYSFKAKKGVIDYSEKANEVLIKQPQHRYPVLLFTEVKQGWKFEGRFSVSGIDTVFVALSRGTTEITQVESSQEEMQYREGGRKYVTHLMAERNRDVVKFLKATRQWVCDVCGSDFLRTYGVRYIEAHHKVPMSTYSSSFVVLPSDFVLLCANCHRAVHIHMKMKPLKYEEIKALLLTHVRRN